MKRVTLLFLVDALAAMSLIGLMATGAVIYFALPAGSGRFATLWGLGRHEWGDLHAWIAFVGVGLVLIHVALHWGWVCATTPRLMGGKPKAPSPTRRRACGIATLLILGGLLSGFTWLATGSISTSPPATVSDDRPDHAMAAGDLRGSMTLSDAAAATELPVATLAQRLGLPPGVDPDQRLRELMPQYGFSMSTVREIAAAEHSNAVP